MENTKEIKKVNKNSRIAVLCGGLSNEREVSLRSGRNVFRALIELGYKDVTLIDVDRNIASVLVENKIEYAINVLHGRYGEDGCIQGVLEFLNIPYSGCGVKASSICMDKIMTKRVLSTVDIPLIKSVNVTAQNYKEEEFVANDGMECCECGCCSYVCPAKRHLTQSIKSMRKIVLSKKKR